MQRHVEMEDEVYAMYHSPKEQLLEMTKNNKRLHISQCDVSKTDEVNRVIKNVLQDGRQIDYIYNVAGLFRPQERGVTLKDIDLDAGLHMYDVNGVGPIRVCKAALPLVGKGTLCITISSTSGSITRCRNKGEYMYNMSKAAVNMGMKILANELWEIGARILLIHPGWLKTQMGGESAAKSNRAITPEQSADDIIEIVKNIHTIPAHHLFMEHSGSIVPW